MKKNLTIQHLILLTLSLTFSATILAQNGNGNGQPNNQWKITGNDADTNNFIGTINLRDIKFKTNNVEHLRLTKEGKLGLGTSNPAAKLDVYGNVILRNLLRIPNTPLTNNLTDKYFIVIDALGNLEKTLVGNFPPWNPPITMCDMVNPDGTIGVLNPFWKPGLNKLYTECPSVFVGIATSTPRVSLDVRGNAYMNKLNLGIADPLLSEAYLHLKAIHIPTSAAKMMLVESNEQELLSLNYQGLLKTRNVVINALDNVTPFIIQNSTQKLLQVDHDGLLHARRIKVDTDTWADFVFDKNYLLMPLSEVKTFININNRLPNVPSETDVKENGVDLLEMNKVLLQKVEELTLYLIDQNEELQVQKNELNELKLQLEKVKSNTKNK